METVKTIISFILMFGALIAVHEFGHLIFAKRAGILCREFAIGMGPKIFTRKIGETVYSLRLLPIGGYVRMAGQDPEQFELQPGQQIAYILNDEQKIIKIIPENFDKYPTAQVMEVEAADLDRELFIRGFEGEEAVVTYAVDPDAVYMDNGNEMQIAPYNRQFDSKTLPQRSMAIFGGPMMNFLFAALLFMVLGFMQGIPTDQAEIGEILPGGNAEQYGLQQGDQVQSINGIQVGTWTEVVENIRSRPGETAQFQITRDGQGMTLDVAIKAVDAGEQQEIGQIGVMPSMTYSPLKVIPGAVTQTYGWTKQIFILLGNLVTGKFSVKDLSGPVGIYETTDMVVKTGFENFLRWAAILSINLGIMNLLPLPALDGGRLVFFLVEAVRGKPIDREKEGMVHFVGFALLMLLMVVVTWNDIQRIFFS